MVPPAPRAPAVPATMALIAVMVATFLLSIVMGGGLEGSQDPDVLYRLGAQDAPSIWHGEWWRLVTAVFLHAGPVHLAANGFSLYVLGRVIEPTLGMPRYLVLFFVSGLVSGLATLVFVQDTLGVGASGAVFGLAGLLLADELTRRRMYRRIALEGGPRWRPRVSIIPILLLNLALGLVIPIINMYAHVGGLVAGFLLGTAWIERNMRRRTRSRLAYLALGLLIVVLGAAGFRPVYTGEAAEHAASRAIIAANHGLLDEALAFADEAVDLAPRDPRFLQIRAQIHARRGDMAAALADAQAACDAGLAEACRALNP
ncbi:MAG TPA: rhomboid family intramembrane serine protease [Thermodesulfobacteriota bacterium]